MSRAEPLEGLRVLVTAGPTREAIDPVRYISNRSSGKMGFAVARAARDAGARVTLISGPVNRSTPKGVWRVNVDSAEDMQKAVLQYVPDTDIFIAAAAVADYRAKEVSPRKIKKAGDSLSIELVRNPDILATVAGQPEPPFTVGFAAETENVTDNARAKLFHKNLDMIAANQVGHNQAFDQDDNALTVIWDEGEQTLPLQSKRSLAMALIGSVARLYRSKRAKGERA